MINVNNPSAAISSSIAFFFVFSKICSVLFRHTNCQFFFFYIYFVDQYWIVDNFKFTYRSCNNFQPCSFTFIFIFCLSLHSKPDILFIISSSYHT